MPETRGAMTAREMGRKGALKRWANFTPSVVKIADLSVEQRRVILALVSAARTENQKATAEAQNPAVAESSEQAHDRPTTTG